MGRVSHYLLKSFSGVFSSLFFTLFFIASIIFFIKISLITSVVKINFFELLLLYLYLLPNILIYTLPVTFFIALSVSLFNLSKENETIVLFTLGYAPNKIAKFFIIVSSIVSLLLIVNILVLIPTAKQLNANFIDYKRAEAKFNIKATEFGQKFSDWLVFIDKSDQTDSYSGIVLYQENTITNKQKIITSLGADIENINGKLRLNLNTGKAFEISIDKIEQVDFAKMYIKADPKDHISEVKDIYSYWIEALHDDKREKDLAFFLLIALFPLATVLFAISFGIVTYRYEKSKINFMIAVVILGYMVPGVLLVEHIGLGAVLVTVSISAITSYLYYRKKIILRY